MNVEDACHRLSAGALIAERGGHTDLCDALLALARSLEIADHDRRKRRAIDPQPATSGDAGAHGVRAGAGRRDVVALPLRLGLQPRSGR